MTNKFPKNSCGSKRNIFSYNNHWKKIRNVMKFFFEILKIDIIKNYLSEIKNELFMSFDFFVNNNESLFLTFI